MTDILDFSNKNLTVLPDLPDSLQTLYCSYNQLTILPDLTQCKDLQYLKVRGNNFSDEMNEILFNDNLNVQEKIKQLDDKNLFMYNNNFILK